MTDHIEREAALAVVAQWLESVFGIRESDGTTTVYKRMRAIPAADVRPVVRGRWLQGDAYPHHVYCSNCYCTYIPNDRWQIWVDKCGDGGLPRDYCPNCGADMREEDEG